MGTSNSVAELTRKLDGLARDMADTRIPLNAAALAAKTAMAATDAPVIGRQPAGTRKLVGVRYDIYGRGPDATAVVSFTGPAHLLLNPTKPHEIVARRLRVMSRRNQRGSWFSVRAATRTTRSGAVRSNGKLALTIGPDLRAYAFHPGTRGLDPGAMKAKAAAAKVAPRAFARAGLTEPLRRNFT